MTNTGLADVNLHEYELEEHLPPALRELFDDGGAGRRMAVALPPGDLVWPDPDYAPQREPARPALWLTDEPSPAGLWSPLRAEHPSSGLWPVLLDESTQPWSYGQLAPEPIADIARCDVAAFMSVVWSGWMRPRDQDDIEDLAPFGATHPGLAPPGELMDDPEVIADWFASTLDDSSVPLGLVAVERSADVMTTMGWQGAANHSKSIAMMSAVVRSWEDRFGARVVRLGFDTLDLSVAAPPTTMDHALHVAAEHWSFSPDNVSQGSGVLADYAEKIMNQNSWSFWWD